MEKKEFINLIIDGALRGMTDYGILPSLTIAQAILESSWGNSKLAQRANNLFGIKAFSDWSGSRITLSTTECVNGEMKIVDADFRSYASYNDSIVDHSKLLSNARYKPVTQCSDYKTACKKILECGYATDPEYAEKLICIIEENKLYEFDNYSNSNQPQEKSEFQKIQKFQHLCNVLNIKDNEGRPLTEDNILGPRTKNCITKMPVLSIGSQGAAIEFVQEVVMGNGIDGDFGPITKQAIIE